MWHEGEKSEPRSACQQQQQSASLPPASGLVNTQGSSKGFGAKQEGVVLLRSHCFEGRGGEKKKRDLVEIYTVTAVEVLVGPGRTCCCI